MTAKTHVSLGAASVLYVLHPTSPEYVVFSMIAGAISAAIPDIDIKKSHSKIDNLIPKRIAFAGIILFILADLYFHVGIVEEITRDPYSELSGAVILVIYAIIGFYSPHRGFTHSIIGMLFSSLGVFLIYPEILPHYFVGYSSHVLIDLLNRKKVKITYPIGKGCCMGLCGSDGTVNGLIHYLSLVAIILYFITMRL